MLNTILIVIGIIFAIILVAAAILPKKTTIVSEINIEKPVSTVFDYVKYLNNQHHYNKWVMADPSAEFKNTGTDATVGYKLYWNSKNNNVGEGEQEITEIVDQQKIAYEIRFERPFKGTSNSIISVNQVNENSTAVTMTFESVSKYPYNLMSAIMSSMLKKDMQQTLTNLQGVLK